MTETHSRYYIIRRKLENFQPADPHHAALWEFLLFGFKQGWACLFGGLMLALLLLTKWLWTPEIPLARYDFLFLCALMIQTAMLCFRLETLEEAKVIFIFHVTGTLMELFKTQAGSWNYPEAAFFRIGNVPLFSGFMYAAVGSYMARITRIFDMRYSNFPPARQAFLLATAIYVNFFAHHFVPDCRNLLFLLTGAMFGQCTVYFRPHQTTRHMPLLLGFALVALFIWLGENIGSFTATWLYPHQLRAWQPVTLAKYGSWFLLMIISFVLVIAIHKPKPPD